MSKKTFPNHLKTFVDLFCGIGGFRIALESKGLECLFSCDIDKEARNYYKHNYHELPAGDITKVSEKDIPKHDVLCAGFPCQSFSLCGRRKGFGDNRGNLFYEIVRIAKYHKPKVLFLENVPHILTVDNGKTLSEILKSLEGIGYRVNWFNLNSANWGIPQSRRRVYFVCTRGDRLISKPYPTGRRVYLKDVLDDNVSENYWVNRDDIVIFRKPQGNYLRPYRIGYLGKNAMSTKAGWGMKIRKGQRVFSDQGTGPTITTTTEEYYHVSQGARIYAKEGVSISINSAGGGVGKNTGLYEIGGRIRRLTINECRKLMGFPEGFILPQTKRNAQRLLGNAVIPKMVSVVFDCL